MSRGEAEMSRPVLYLECLLRIHVRCWVGIGVQESGKRAKSGSAYTFGSHHIVDI